MTDYRTLYYMLLAAQVDAIDGLNTVIASLISAHKKVEELYINASDSDDAVQVTKVQVGRESSVFQSAQKHSLQTGSQQEVNGRLPKLSRS